MFKKVLTALVVMTCLFTATPHTSEAATAVGIAPVGMVGAQARVLARRAAQVMAIRNCGGRMPQIISEAWNPDLGQYIINY